MLGLTACSSQDVREAWQSSKGVVVRAASVTVDTLNPVNIGGFVADALFGVLTQTGYFLSDLFGEPGDREDEYRSLALIKGCEHAIPVIQKAAARTRVSPNYLLALAKQESGCRSNARAKSSSAVGMFQFVEATWLSTLHSHGAKYGYRDMATSIVTDSRGRPRVLSRAKRAEILAKRMDAQLSAYLAAELALENARFIRANKGSQRLSATDLYMAHFLGAPGALRFLTELDRNPNGAAHRLLPAAARSNPSVFFVRANRGNPRSFKEVYSIFERRIKAV